MVGTKDRMNYRLKYAICVVVAALLGALGVVVMTKLPDQRAFVTALGPPLVVSMILQGVVNAGSVAAVVLVFVVVFGTYAAVLFLPMLYFFRETSRSFLLLIQAVLIVIHSILGYVGMLWIQSGIGT